MRRSWSLRVRLSSSRIRLIRSSIDSGFIAHALMRVPENKDRLASESQTVERYRRRKNGLWRSAANGGFARPATPFRLRKTRFGQLLLCRRGSFNRTSGFALCVAHCCYRRDELLQGGPRNKSPRTNANCLQSDPTAAFAMPTPKSHRTRPARNQMSRFGERKQIGKICHTMNLQSGFANCAAALEVLARRSLRQNINATAYAVIT